MSRQRKGSGYEDMLITLEERKWGQLCLFPLPINLSGGGEFGFTPLAFS